MKQRMLNSAVLFLALAPLPALAVIVDRIVATVGPRVITLSEVQETWRTERLLNHEPLRPLEARNIREVADRLIDQALIQQEMETSHFPTASVGEVDERMAELERNYGGSADFRQILRNYGVEEEAVRQRLELQVNISRFIELRFRPIVQVDAPAIERYYRETLLPQLRAQNAREIPALDEVRDRIEQVLIQQRINRESSAWIKQLREQANIVFR